MSKHVKYVPKHRGAPVRPGLPEAPRKAIRTTVVLSSVAVAATGASVSGGVFAGGATATNAAAADVGTAPLGNPVVRDDDGATGGSAGAGSADLAAAGLGEREPVVSRSARREAVDPVKRAALSATDSTATVGEEDLSDADPREIAQALLAEFGFGADQFSCLDSLYTRESNWNPTADNPTSSAYGIPQALPGSKMSSAGADWETNPVTQIRWGLGYIQDRYGSPCGAWGHSQSHGWY